MWSLRMGKVDMKTFDAVLSVCLEQFWLMLLYGRVFGIIGFVKARGQWHFCSCQPMWEEREAPCFGGMTARAWLCLPALQEVLAQEMRNIRIHGKHVLFGAYHFVFNSMKAVPK